MIENSTSAEYHIDFSDVDFKQNIKLSSLFAHMQDVAGTNVEQLGFGINSLIEKYGVTWVLLRIKVEIERIPALDEKIKITTWPLEPNRLMFERDFIIRDSQGKVILRGVSSWAFVDVNTRKLRPTTTINFDSLKFTNTRALDYNLVKLKSFGEPEVAYKRVIGYSDIDFNGHLNNTKYIDFIMDCFTYEEHKKYEVRSLEVNYLQEAFPGDTLVIYKDISRISENIIYVEGVNEKSGSNESNGSVVFRAQAEIRPCKNFE